MNKGSSIFMLVGATGLVLLLGLPLLLAPLGWARKLGWTLPERTELTNYFGRSLGGVSLSIAAVAYLAARDPWQYRAMFLLVILLGVLMTGVHLYGLIKKNQPRFENVETFLYPLVSLLAWYFYPHQP
jgi:hypothetical protein